MAKKKRGGCLWVVLLILLLLIGLVVGGGLYVMDHYLDKINKVDPEDVSVIPPEMEDFETDEGMDPDYTTDSSDTPSDTSSNTSSTQPEPSKPAFDDDKLLNILLVGQDRREGEGRQRSDSMILCSINTETGKVSLISFLRDLYVSIPGGYSDNRLNASYAFGGFKLLDATLTHNFGVTIDGNLEVDFNRFTDVINAVGGVDVYVTKAEAQYLKINNGAAGTVHMDGALALEYSRIRKLDSDFNRTGRQRNVLMAVFNNVKGMSPTALVNLANKILPMFSTDMSNSELLSLIAQLAPTISSLEISNYSIPAEGAYYRTYIRGMAVLVPNLALNRQVLGEKYLPLK